jgi:hypothetical protein
VLRLTAEIDEIRQRSRRSAELTCELLDLVRRVGLRAADLQGAQTGLRKDLLFALVVTTPVMRLMTWTWADSMPRPLSSVTVPLTDAVVVPRAARSLDPRLSNSAGVRQQARIRWDAKSRTVEEELLEPGSPDATRLITAPCSHPTAP